MLKRLETSQEQTVWYSLWDKVWQPDNLAQAIVEVIGNRGSAGVDGQTTQQFKADWTCQQERLQQELRSGRYRPQPARRAWIPKLGSAELRPLGIPAVRDRVVQTALRAVVEPIFEREFAEQSYGFRPGRGSLQALQRVESLLQSGHTWVVDADLKGYLDGASYYTPVHGVVEKSCGCWSKTRIRKPFCRPRDTWTMSNSPRLTRCMIVCRETPRTRMASGMAT